MFLHQFGVILASSFSVLSAFPVGFLGGICAFLGHFCVSEALFFEDKFCAALAEPQCCTKLFFKNTCPSELLKQIQRRYSLDAFPPPTSYPLPPLTLPEKPQNPHSSADGGTSKARKLLSLWMGWAGFLSKVGRNLIHPISSQGLHHRAPGIVPPSWPCHPQAFQVQGKIRRLGP